MKVIAVTTPNVGCDELDSKIYQLKQKKVSHVYLRDLFLLKHESERMIQMLLDNAIVPLVSADHIDYAGSFRKDTCVHLKEHQGELVDAASHDGSIFSMSVHSFASAEKALSLDIPYIMISPVFLPLSKPEDKRAPLDRKRLFELVDRYGERVVLLGGMTQKRVNELRDRLKRDFSYAGITMFWGDDDTHTD